MVIDNDELSELLSKKLDKKIVVKEIIPINSGFHSDGYKITTEDDGTYFLKKINTEDIGNELPERKVMSYLVSHSMLNRHNISPGSVGVAIRNKKLEFLPDIDDNTEVYHVQEYGGEGKSYLSMLDQKAGKEHIDQTDKDEIDKVIDYIVPIHKTKPIGKSSKMLNALYNDYLRSVIGHPEYNFILHYMPEDSPVLKPKEQGEFVALMHENMHYFKDKSQRLGAIHGDFWGANLFFREDGSVFLIDHSRMPWGDPGFDVGIWMSQYLIRYHITGSKYFKELGDYFLQQYINKTGDKGITKTMVYSLGVVSTIYASSNMTPGIENKVRMSFYENVHKMLKDKEFSWEY
jgi:thiamine kinase-like enzyme